MNMFRVYQISDLEEYYSLAKFALAFARTKAEAIEIATDKLGGSVGATKLNKSPWLMEESRGNYPHVVMNPKSCKVCERWGYSPIGNDGMCDDCRNDLRAGNIG